MGVYLLYIAIVFIFLFCAKYLGGNVKDNNGKVIKRRNNKIFLWLALLSMMSVYALRYYVGTDFGGYYHSYLRLAESDMSLSEFLSSTGYREKLYGILMYVCSQIFGAHWVPFAFVCAFLTYWPIMKVLNANSTDITASTLMYIFILAYFTGFNGVRQGIAEGFVALAFFEGLKKRKYVKYSILMFIAYEFHSTALIVIPVHILALLPFYSKPVRIGLIAGASTVILLDSVWAKVINFLTEVGQDKLASDYAVLSDNGSSLLRLIVFALPLILGVAFYYRLKREDDGTLDSELVFMSFIVLMLFASMRNWIFARIGSYFNIGLVLFLPRLEGIFPSRNRSIGKWMIVLLYFAYMVALLLHGEGHLLPYQFIFGKT